MKTEAREVNLSVRWECDKVSTFSFEEEIHRLLLGAPFPLEYVLHGAVLFPSQIVFAYFFLHRVELLDPLAMPLIHALNVPWALRAHFPKEVTSLLYQLEIPHDLESGLRTVEGYFAGWGLSFLPGRPLKVLDQGTSGFVVAESATPWRGDETDLYQLFTSGHLRGVVFYPDFVLIFAKSKACWDLDPLETQLRAIHEAGNLPAFLRTREGNLLGKTLLTRDQILNLCVRV